MRFVYFTKTLQALDGKGLIAFCKETGLEGLDLAVRPGYPVTPDNVSTELPALAKACREEGLSIGLVTAPTSLTDANAKAAHAIFEGCARAGVPAVKVGYFPHKGPYDDAVRSARLLLAGFARLAEKTGVKACYHTHSGAYLGNNAAGLRLLLQDLDPHHVGAFADTGHLAVNGGPFPQEADILRNWLSLLAIKDMLWEKGKDGWKSHVVPVGEGIVRWNEVASGLKDVKFNGTIVVHGEYEAPDLATRKKLASQELALLRKLLG